MKLFFFFGSISKWIRGRERENENRRAHRSSRLTNTRAKLERWWLRNYCYYTGVQQTGTSEVAAAAASFGLIQSTSSKSVKQSWSKRARMSGALAPSRISNR